MFATQQHRSLTQRLSQQHLLLGFAGLFCFAGLAIYLSRHGMLLNSMPLAILLPALLLVLGVSILRRSMRWHENLERQLTRFATAGDCAVSELRPIPANDPLSSGWNQLLSRVQEQSAWNGIERRLSESVNSQQAKRWEAVFQSLTDGIAICDSEGKIVQLNRSFATLLKRADSQTLLGMDLFALLAENADQASMERLHQLGDSQSYEVFEIQRSNDLSQGVWRLSRNCLSTVSSNATESVWTLRDITQQKLAEKAREQFVFTATHELRTPLANIRAYSETLASAGDIPFEQQQSFYNTINNEASRLARFVDELLNISQMEAGAITIVKRELQLDRLLNEIIDGQKPLANEKSQTFDYSVTPKLPKILADKDKLAAAVTNLVSNAIKYTPDGGKVSVRVDSDNDRVLFHVEDSGIGISNEDLPKLCNKFFRSSDDRVQSIVGSGLGLAFSQEVARLHGGSVSIRSQLNQGSCFTLEIPTR